MKHLAQRETECGNWVMLTDLRLRKSEDGHGAYRKNPMAKKKRKTNEQEFFSPLSTQFADGGNNCVL